MNDDGRIIRALRQGDREPGPAFTDTLLDRLEAEVSRDREVARAPKRHLVAYIVAAAVATVFLYLFSGTALFQHWSGDQGRPTYLIIGWSLLLGIGMLALRGARSKQTV